MRAYCIFFYVCYNCYNYISTEKSAPVASVIIFMIFITLDLYDVFHKAREFITKENFLYCFVYICLRSCDNTFLVLWSMTVGKMVHNSPMFGIDGDDVFDMNYEILTCTNILLRCGEANWMIARLSIILVKYADLNLVRSTGTLKKMLQQYVNQITLHLCFSNSVCWWSKMASCCPV